MASACLVQLHAHFLDLRGLLFELLCEERHPLLEHLHFAVFFQELVEQHRVHLVVAHGVGFSLFVAYHQIRNYLFYLFGYEPELRFSCRINSFLYRKVTGLSAKSASLALSIGLMSSLKRFEETVVPSLLAELMRTGIPPADVWPKMLPM